MKSITPILGLSRLYRGSGANQFKPSDISGIIINAEASTLSASDGDAIGSFDVFTQATSGQKPLFKTNIIKGQSALLFDNVDDGMTSSVSINVPYDIFIVEKYLSNNGNKRTIGAIGANCLVSGQRSDGLTAYINGNTIGTFTTTAPAVVILNLYTNTNMVFTVNGVDKTANVIADANFGTIGIGTNSEPANTYIAAIIVYNNTISSANRTLMMNYLTNKYI